jgi:hypothetical protein
MEFNLNVVYGAFFNRRATIKCLFKNAFVGSTRLPEMDTVPDTFSRQLSSDLAYHRNICQEMRREARYKRNCGKRKALDIDSANNH